MLSEGAAVKLEVAVGVTVAERVLVKDGDTVEVKLCDDVTLEDGVEVTLGVAVDERLIEVVAV